MVGDKLVPAESAFCVLFLKHFILFPLHVSAAQLLSYPGKNKIPLNYHIVEV